LRGFFLCVLASLVGALTALGLTGILADQNAASSGSPMRAARVGAVSAGSTVTGDSTLFLTHLGYGMNVRDPGHLDMLFAPLGFEWIKLYEQYDALPTTRLSYKVLYRLQLNGPPDDLAAWGAHVQAVAQAGRGWVEAYEIGNEPNQSWQWGDQVPDPDEYVAALQVAYARIKAVDPDALVVSGGLGPVGRIQATPNGEGKPGNNGASMDEWAYARRMFSQCGTGCFDVFGYHPFGFAYPPETLADSVENNFAFRGAEDLRQIMLEYDLGDKPMWATEFGWIRHPNPDGFGWCTLVPGFNDYFGWMLVSELQQADYLSRSFAYADAHWPWMEAMFVWNLDWNDQGWDCDNIRFFSLRYVEGGATPAYAALAAMGKRPGPAGCRLLVEPSAFVYAAEVGQSRPVTAGARVSSLAGCEALTWSATLAPSSTLRLTSLVTQGRPGDALTFTFDSGAWLTQGTGTVWRYPSGTYTAAVRITAIPSDVLSSPYTLPITLRVTAAWQRVYLPLALRRR